MQISKKATAIAAFCLTLSIFCSSTAFAAETGSTQAIEDLSLTPGNTASDLNLTWYTDNNTANNQSQVRFLTQDGKVAAAAKGTAAVATEGKLSHKVTVTGLKADTAYTYQVSGDGAQWSSGSPYKTSAADRFSFAYIGDPQLNHGKQDSTSKLFSSDQTTAQGWKDTMTQISKSGVNFIASAGDQIDGSAEIKENEYTDFFAPASLKSIPLAPSVGNHDRSYLFLYHYNLPNQQSFGGIATTDKESGNTDPSTGAVTNQERKDVEAMGNYYYSYGNSLFVVLNDSAYPASKAEAAPFISNFDATLKAANAAYPNHKWLFVQHHKSTASVAQHVADKDIEYYVEAGFEKLMDKYHVDFVLAGHDHVYVRSAVMRNGKAVDKSNSVINANGTVYFTATTASGLKYYNIFDTEKLYEKNNTVYPILANGLAGSAEYLKKVYPLSTNFAVQKKIPEYTKISVDGSSVTFHTYDINSATPIDTFTVSKSAVTSDTTASVKIARGKSYVFQLTSAKKPNVTAGNSGLFQMKPVSSSGNHYYYRITAVGKAGQSAGIYSSVPGEKAVRQFTASIAG